MESIACRSRHNAGVITNEEFAEFQNAGYMGLYGGMTVDEIHSKKGLDIREKILNFMGSEELIANLFRISQTESKLKRENIQGTFAANDVHYVVGREVREAIKHVDGTMPEDLPRLYIWTQKQRQSFLNRSGCLFIALFHY